MGRYYRYRLPRWLAQCILIIEQCTLPILFFQLIRTLFFATIFDVILLILLIVLYVAFFLEWI